MKLRIVSVFPAIVLVAIIGTGLGCIKKADDAKITSGIQASFSGDSGLQGKQLGVQAENGVVTLSGSVDTDAQRTAASRYAAAAPGVKEVVNNLQVTAAAAPAPARTRHKRSQNRRQFTVPTEPVRAPAPARKLLAPSHHHRNDSERTEHHTNSKYAARAIDSGTELNTGSSAGKWAGRATAFPPPSSAAEGYDSIRHHGLGPTGGRRCLRYQPARADFSWHLEFSAVSRRG